MDTKTGSSSSTDATMPPSEFTLFPQLPLELRLKVWGFALTEPRIVKISCKKGFTDIGRRITEYFICHNPTHPILHVNQEARFEGLTTYSYVPFFQTTSSDRYTYINFDYDIIRCPASVLEYLGPAEIKAMRKMVLEVGDAAYFGHFHMDTIVRMKNLEELELLSEHGLVYGWDKNRDVLVERLTNDFQGARFEDPGWRCPRVSIVNIKTGGVAGVIEGGPLLEGWKIGDDYPEDLV
ncbi:uncharacterized protein LY89DRAFT_780436 [Mollisia scopiformis]|uniref:2EXR domain-containing protein n=1 Tax=Mollisia scopiformis TaxID=149040 RepID=A0A194XH94_MOLSC|nr:uncharacterized protein LY89DRAFT_780436 [Mollisia scopiformis]KUJ19511.1 hypothetical protein LY89DRAFT_780436 [Mollisia scopiformis]